MCSTCWFIFIPVARISHAHDWWGKCQKIHLRHSPAWMMAVIQCVYARESIFIANIYIYLLWMRRSIGSTPNAIMITIKLFIMAREEYDGYVGSCDSAPSTIIAAPIGPLSFLCRRLHAWECSNKRIKYRKYISKIIHIFIHVPYLMHGDEMVVIYIIYYCYYCYYHRLAFCGVQLHIVVGCHAKPIGEPIVEDNV